MSASLMQEDGELHFLKVSEMGLKEVIDRLE